jgi:osmotically-inducible protein OsmY
VTVQDEALSAMVRNAIARDKRIGGLAIAVRVAHGEVMLKGMVDDDEQLELARLVAGGISGVRQVNTDELQVKEGTESE